MLHGHRDGVSVAAFRRSAVWRLLSWSALALAMCAAAWLAVPQAVCLAAGAPVKYQQDDPRFGYTGSWSTLANTSADGGDFVWAQSAASVTVAFDGSYLAWIGKKSPSYGKAKVTLDGTQVFTVDLYRTSTVWKTTLWETPAAMTSGRHSVKIEWTGVKSVPSGNTLINVDAFLITGTVAESPVVNRHQQDDSHIAYTGAWIKKTGSAYSRGSMAQADKAGASATVEYRGTYLAWIGDKGPGYGQAKVTFDGVTSTVDLYSDTAVSRKVIWRTPKGVASGVHTLKIEWSGVPSAASGGTAINIDAFDVIGVLRQAYPVNRYQENNALLVYTGTWSAVAAPKAAGMSYMATGSGSDSVEMTFNGRSLDWTATTGPSMGKAFVSVDGGAPVSVDLNSPAVAYRQKVWTTGALAIGEHHVQIRRDPSSGTASISLDYVEVAGTLIRTVAPTRYEENDPRFWYTGTWATVRTTSAYGDSYRRGGTGSGVMVTFAGTRLDWVAVLGPTMGKAEISVDGKAPITVDLGNSTTVYRQVVWSTGRLANGKHTVDIGWDESNAAGTYISVDAFNVLGSVPWPTSLNKEQIKWVEQRLSDLSYRPGAIDGVADKKTTGAVIAFQKWEGLSRTGVISTTVLSRLQSATRPKPTRMGGSNGWIEVNKTKQTLLYCKDGAVVWTIPVCTGSAAVGIVTPSGDFRVTRKTREISPRYYPLYIRATGYLAIHGYPKVPVYPASHGCIRTQTWDQDYLWPLIAVGTPVYIR